MPARFYVCLVVLRQCDVVLRIGFRIKTQQIAFFLIYLEINSNFQNPNGYTEAFNDIGNAVGNTLGSSGLLPTWLGNEELTSTVGISAKVGSWCCGFYLSQSEQMPLLYKAAGI